MCCAVAEVVEVMCEGLRNVRGDVSQCCWIRIDAVGLIWHWCAKRVNDFSLLDSYVCKTSTVLITYLLLKEWMR